MSPIPMNASRMVAVSGSPAPPSNRGPSGWPVSTRLRMIHSDVMATAAPANAPRGRTIFERLPSCEAATATITAPVEEQPGACVTRQEAEATEQAGDHRGPRGDRSSGQHQDHPQRDRRIGSLAPHQGCDVHEALTGAECQRAGHRHSDPAPGAATPIPSAAFPRRSPRSRRSSPTGGPGRRG